MRMVVQRVLEARVTVNGEIAGAIGPGLLVLLGIARGDTVKDVDYLVEKLVQLRLFPDEAGKMNLSLAETGGSLLVVSQFTLLGDCRRGRRPSFDAAAPPEEARDLYDHFVSSAQRRVKQVATGVFRAAMEVTATNSGPVTLIVESRPVDQEKH